MTSSSTFKKNVRALAEERGISYTEARRLLVNGMTGLIDKAAAADSGPPQERYLSIHREIDSRGSVPMPFFVHANGMIRRQDFWKGEPYFLIGFEDPAAAVASPDGHDITVTRDEWFEDPQKVIGMQIVTMNRGRDWATWNGLIESVRENTTTPAAPERATLRLTIPTRDYDEEIPVGHLLEFLTPQDLAAAEAAGWKDCDANSELLWMATNSGDLVAITVQDALDDLDRDDYSMQVIGPAVGKPGDGIDTGA